MCHARFHIIGDYAVGEHLNNNPLINLTQMPMGGIWQTLFTIMCLEWLTTYICKPPEEKPWDILGWTDIIIEDRGLCQLPKVVLHDWEGI